MNNAIRMVLVLVVVGTLSGGMLAGVYNYASPLIEENAEKALKEAIYKVLPEAASYNELKKDKLYEGINRKGDIIGYAFIAEGTGYQGNIKIIAAIDTKFRRLKGMEVLESSETPGLGAKIAEESFKGQFRGLYVLPEITFSRDGDNEIQAITGATISTKSIVDILNKEIARLRKEFGKK